MPQKYVGETATVSYAKFSSRSHNSVIRAYDNAGNVIEKQEFASDFKEWLTDSPVFADIGNGNATFAYRSSSPGLALHIVED